MPKMKTNSSAKKRFKVTPSGKIKRAQAFKNHILTKKTTKQKRGLTKMVVVSDPDMGLIKNLLTIGK
jgi:large subunit ribosomal protein L35